MLGYGALATAVTALALLGPGKPVVQSGSWQVDTRHSDAQLSTDGTTNFGKTKMTFTLGFARVEGTVKLDGAPSVAIDLPLKILVWEDSQRKVWLSYNSPEYLKERHGLPPDLLPNIAVVEALAAKARE